MPKSAVGPVALGAAQAQAALAQAGNVLGGDGIIGQQARQQQMKEVTVQLFKRLDDVIRRARALARPGDIVLFSPACASFDQFPNFMLRGQYFKEQVWALK